MPAKDVWGSATSAADQYLFSPSRAGQVGLSEFERRNNAPYRFTWGVKCLDEYLVPMNPGDLVVLLARPGHGKSSSLVHLTRQANATIEGLYPISDDISNTEPIPHAFYATWETLVEEFVGLFLASASGCSLEDIGRGNADIPSIVKAVAGSVHNRVAVIGQSMAEGARAKRPPTLDDLDEILELAPELGIKPAFLAVDYLQRIPSERRDRDRSSSVSENLERLKDLALRHRIPVVVGVQAKREVDEYGGLKLPALGDGQWTSTIEQTADKVIVQSRPFLYAPHKAFQTAAGDHETAGRWYASTPTAMAIGVPKHRWGPSGATFMVEMDPRTTTLSDAEWLDEDDEAVIKAVEARQKGKRGGRSESSGGDEDIPF